MTDQPNVADQVGNFITRLPKKIADVFVERPLRALDRGEVFQVFYTMILRIFAVLILIAGPLWMVYYIFKEHGWWDQLQGESRFYMLRSVIGLPVNGLVALATILVVAGILWTRAKDLRNEEYQGLIGIFLRLLKTTGEVYSVFPISTALTVFFSAIFAGRPYAPLAPGMGTVTEILSGLTRMLRPLMSLGRGGGGYGEEITIASYLAAVGGSLLGLVLSVFVAITVLAFFYLVAEVLGLLYYFLMRKPMFKATS